MKTKQQNKKYFKIFFLLVIIFFGSAFFISQITSAQSSSKRIDVSGYVLDKKNEPVPDGEYSMTFTIYSGGSSVWNESQSIKTINGFFGAQLGASNSLPENLYFSEGEYSLGVRVGNNSESERKRIGYVPLAINSQYLQGHTIGNEEGDLFLLGEDGKIDIEQLPTGIEENQIVLGNDERLHTQNTDTGTIETEFIIGSEDEADGNKFYLSVSSDDDKPALRYNGDTGAWQYSNDGDTFSDIGSATGSYLSTTGGVMSGNITFASTQTFNSTTLTQLGYLSGVSLSAGSLLYGSSGTALTTLTGLATDDGEYLRFNWNGGAPTISWEALAGGFTSFTLAGDSGTNQTISDGNTLTIAGGTNISTVGGATDTVTINLDSTLSGVTWNGSAIGATYGGTGINTSASTGVPIISGGTWSVSSSLGVSLGGTGLTSYTIGDLIYASGATTLAKLAGVATGNALISGGVGTAPSWGKIGLTTHVSGTLPVTNGGTGTATQFTTGSLVFAGASGVYSQDNTNLFWDDTSNELGINTNTPAAILDVNGNAIISGTSRYLNFNTTSGSTGYGFRDNSGETQYRNSGGQWTSVGKPVSYMYEESWVDTGSDLPGTMLTSSSEVIGDYIYLFGGSVNGVVSSAIFRAPVSDPTSWVNTGSTLPGVLTRSSSAIIGDYVYLFGGHTGSSTNVIYRAPLSNPTSWSNTGSTLPGVLSSSRLEIIGDYVYLFGGWTSVATNVIYRAPLSNPTAWVNTGSTLPSNLAYSQSAIIGDYVYLFGGYTTTYSNVIYRAPLSNPTAWVNTGNTLPEATELAQSVIVGNYVYLLGGFNGARMNKIYRAPVSDPTSWVDTGNTLPEVLGWSTVNVVGDYVYLFGGYATSGYTGSIYRAPINSVDGIFKDSDGTTKILAGKTPGEDNLIFYTSGTEQMRIDELGRLGLGTALPSAFLTVQAGTANPGSSPLKFTAGTNLTTPEAGAIEFDGTSLYFTDSTPTRQTIATISSNQTFTNKTWNGTIIGAAYGGTGINTSASTGVPTISSGTWSVSSSLGVTNGGTGTATQFTTGSLVFAGASGVYSQDNANLFWDDVNNRLGLGTAVPSERLHVVDGIYQEMNANPVLEGSLIDLTNMNGAIGICVNGKYAYIASSGSDSLSIVDISDPSSPTLTGSLIDATNMNNAFGVYVSGDYAYVTGTASNSLAIVDVSDPSSPTLAGSLIDATNMNAANEVYVSGKYAYVAGYASKSLAVVDVSNPANPTLAGSLIDATNLNAVRGVYVSGEYAYVAGSSVLAVVNVSDPTTPTLAGSLIDATNLISARGVYVSGKYAYVASETSNSLSVINISNPANPTLTGVLTDATNMNGASNVHVSGKYAYVTGLSSDSIAVVDVTDPTSPVLAGSLIDSTNMNLDMGIYVSGKYAYVTGYLSGSLAVIDIHGAELTNVLAGNLESNTLNILDDVSIGGQLNLRGGINASGSLFVNGELSVGGGGLVVDSSGDVSIGDITPPNYVFSIQSKDTTHNGTAYINSALNSSGRGLTIDATSRNISDAGISNFAVLDRTGDDSFKVLVNGSTYFGNFSATGASFGKYYLYSNGVIYSSVDTTAASSHYAFYTPSGLAGAINTTSNTTAYTSVSDYRLKENEVTIASALDRVNDLKPYTFNFKVDPNTKIDGFYAHELQKIVPYAVTGQKDEVDENGDPVYQAVDYAKLTPLLTAAIQEESVIVAGLNLKTDQNATTLRELQTSIDEQLNLVGTEILDINLLNENQETRLATLEQEMIAQQMTIVEIEDQLLEISTIKEQVQTLTDFMLAINGNDFVTKDADGNVLLNGKLKAETLEGKGLVISISDPEYLTLGRSEICSVVPVDEDLDWIDDCSGNAIPHDNNEDGKDDVTGDEMPLDENSDWIDDETGEGIVNSGKTRFVETKAAEVTSEIFVTPRSATEAALFVSDVDPGVGFMVETLNISETKIDFGWFIVEGKNE